MYDSLKKHFQQALPFTDEELSAVDSFFEERIFAKKAMLLEALSLVNISFLSSKAVCVTFIPKTTAPKRPVIFRLKINGRPPL